ncbi:MAG: response regulator [Verrucomicrobiota bacterium]|nr:response regulator [Verrucomicrobiota bacterium]
MSQPRSPETHLGAKTDAGLAALRKVVIAEDDAISREILASTLSKWGYEVIVAADGREAMEVLRAQNEPILAILDWMMPGMEGPEICRRLREISKSVYILLLTARAGKERLVEGLRAGADDYLTKPFDKEELQARLNVGARILGLQETLNARVQELEAALSENRQLKLQMPL